MRVLLQAGEVRLEIIDAWEPVVTQVELHPLELHTYMSNPQVVAQMRAALVARTGSMKPEWERDDIVFNEIVRRLGTGEFRLLKTHAPPLPFVPLPVATSAKTKSKASDSSDGSNGTSNEAGVANALSSVPEQVRAQQQQNQQQADDEHPVEQKCSSAGCEQAFSDAAESGTPLVSADTAGC